MKSLRFLTIAAFSLGLTNNVVMAQTAPTILYGATAPLAPGNQFSVTTTPPPAGKPRSHYVVLAEVNDSKRLEVLAWQDTTSALDAISTHGTAGTDVVSVAAAGLDADRVATADIDASGVLSIRSWRVGTGGVAFEHVLHTAAKTAAKDVALTALSPREVVAAYETPGGMIEVQAFLVDCEGEPSARPSVGKGPKGFETSIATLNSHRVVTASGDSGGALWVNTWEIDSTGVKPLSHVQTSHAVAKECIVAPRPQTVAVGAGESLQAHGALVQSAFTPIINPDCNFQVYYWGVSNTGGLTLDSTATPTEAGDFGQVGAAMLSRNIPMSAWTGGTGDNNVFLEDYTGFSLTDLSGVSYGDPYGALNTASASAGTDLSSLSLYDPYHAYFVSAGQFGPQEGSTDGTLLLNIVSYPGPPLL